MPLSFPTDPAPVNGDEYTYGGRTWVYNATIPAWEAKPLPNHAADHAAGGTDPITPGQLLGILGGMSESEINTFRGILTNARVVLAP